MYERRERRGGGFGRGGGGFGGGGRGFGRGGGFERDDKPKPIKVGEEHNVKITDVGAKGDGITKIENFIVFVAGAKKGEECRVRIKEVASRFAIAEKIGASESSDEGSEENKDESSEETSESEESSEEQSGEEENKDE